MSIVNGVQNPRQDNVDEHGPQNNDDGVENDNLNDNNNEQKNNSTNHELDQAEDLSSLDEYHLLDTHLNLDNLQTEIVKDQKERVIIFYNLEGHKKYKSVFVPRKNLLKIIDLNNGLLFKGSLNSKEENVDNNASQEKESMVEENNNYEELNKVKEYIDLEQYHYRIVEENKRKRIMFYYDQQQQTKYKTVYDRHKNWLKIIDFQGSPLFNGQI